MSKYTTEVRFICESLSGNIEQQGYSQIDEILTNAAPLVFDFDFPIFDEDYRLGLEKKILKHFYTREISEETVGLWKLRLNERMNLIMPYYNQLYSSELIEFDPMQDTSLETSHSKTGTGSTSGSSTGGSKKIYDEDTSVNASDKEVMSDDMSSTSSQETETTTSNDTSDAYSDTPQGSLSNVKALDYLTNARLIENDVSDTTYTTGKYSGSEDKTTTDTSETTGTKDSTTTTTNEGTTTGSSNSTEEYIQNIAGKRSLNSFSKYLIEFRQTFLNIDNMVINELNDLFIQLW